MKTQGLVSMVMALLVTATLILASPVANNDGTISDQGISSEIVLAHELTH